MYQVSPEPLFKLLEFTPHEGQQTLFDSPYRFNVYICGRRWGKSLLAARWAEQFILVPGTRGWVVSKTYDLTRKVIREIRTDLVHKMMHPLGMKLQVDQQSGPIVMEFPWGSVVEGKSVEHPESLLGEKLDWLVFDEFAKCKESAWEFYLRPTLTDKKGKALFISTPSGYNWGFDYYNRGFDPKFAEWNSYKSPSWTNPHLPQDDIEEARQTLSNPAFMQEYGADFTLRAGQVYKEFDEGFHVIPEEKLVIDPAWERYRSIDFGYENPFACLYLAVDEEDRVYVYKEYVKRHATVEQHARFLNEEEETTFPIDPITSTRHGSYEYTTCDPSGASARATLYEKGIPTLAARSDVAHGLEAVRQQLKIRDDGTSGIYVSSACIETILEFNLYIYHEDRMSEDPVKEHDHCMDSLRYFIVNWRKGYIKQSHGVYG